jgi:hypothetical protein
MKPFAIAITSALLASAATTALHAVFLRPAPAQAADGVAPSVAPRPRETTGVASAAPAALSGREQELLARLDELERSLARIDDDVKFSAARSAVVEPVAASAVAVAPEFVRDVANQVIEENKAKEKAALETAQAERDKERALRRAEQVAKELGLSPSDQEQLALVYDGESTKRRELFAQLGFGDGGPRDFLSFGPEQKDQMRDGMNEIRTWRSSEMVTRFGSSLADQIAELDSQRRDRGFGGGFGGSGFGGGGGGFGGGGGSKGNGGKDGTPAGGKNGG